MGMGVLVFSARRPWPLSLRRLSRSLRDAAWRADTCCLLQVGTVVEWVENADKWIAGFLGKFEEGVYNVVSGAPRVSARSCAWIRISS